MQDLLDKSSDMQSKAVSGETAGRMPPAGGKIYDLVDVVSTEGASDTGPVESEHIPPDRKIHDLVDVVKDDYLVVSCDKELEAAVMKKVAEITERITRELVPDIAERIIREEIEKLKG
jgi:hypothetical protein